MSTTDLTAGEDREPTRTKNPSYDIFRATQDGDWAVIAESVQAPSRKAAITTATQGHEEQQYGTFMVIPSAAIKILTRAVKTDPQDVWT
jgi:hypothetical protein